MASLRPVFGGALTLPFPQYDVAGEASSCITGQTLRFAPPHADTSD